MYAWHFIVVSFPLRSSPSGDVSVTDASEEPQLTEGRLTKEEWQVINKLLSYQPDEELNLPSGKDMQNMIQFLVNVSIGQAAARIISMNQTEIVCGRFEQLDVSTKFKHWSIHCNVSLKFYGLNALEGSFAQSVSSAEGECISCQFCTLTCWRECGLEAFRYYFSLPCYGFGGKL